MHHAHASDRRRGHLEDLPMPREKDELRAIERREIDHLAVEKEFEDQPTNVEKSNPATADVDPDDAEDAPSEGEANRPARRVDRP
jgi:hypothetical protein